MPQKTTHSKKGGGMFTSADSELVAFDRLKQLLYIAKNCSQDKNPSSFAKTLNYLRRLGFPLLNVCKKDPAAMRCDAFKSKITSARRLFFSSFTSTSSVTSSVFSKNKSVDPTDLYPPKRDNPQTTKDLKFPNVRSKTIKDLAPIDFASYLMFEADNKTKVTSSSLFKQVNSRLPYFKTTDEFTTAFNELANLTYIQRSEVFYVFAEFYLRLSQRSHALYQVELDSYGSLILDGSADQKRKDAHRKLKNNLSKGDRTRRIATGTDDNSSYLVSDPLTDFISSQNGLPITALRGGALWSSDDGPNIPMTTALQMAEILLNEPLFSDKDVNNPTIELKQTLEIDGYDPLLLGSLDALSVNKHKHYVEDVRKKLHISLREVRKNLLLHRYKKQIDTYSVSKDIGKYENEVLPVESKVSEVLRSVFRPVVAEIDHAVLPNLAEAYKFVFSETSSLGPSELDSLLSRSSFSSPSYTYPSSTTSHLSGRNAPASGNMPVL